MADAFDNLDDWQLPECVIEKLVETTIVKRRKAEKKRRFTKGPLPVEWQKRCNKTSRHGLLVVQAILMKSGKGIFNADQSAIIVGKSFAEDLGLSRYQRLRTIIALKAAGLLEVEHKPNRAPRVRLVPWRQEDD